MHNIQHIFVKPFSNEHHGFYNAVSVVKALKVHLHHGNPEVGSRVTFLASHNRKITGVFNYINDGCSALSKGI